VRIVIILMLLNETVIVLL